MPPQPGVFALPYSSSSSKSRPASHQTLPEGSGSGVDAMGIPYHSHNHGHNHIHNQGQHYQHNHHSHHHGVVAGPSSSTSRAHGSLDDGKKERRRKEIAGKLGKEMSDRRDDGRYINETIASLHATALQLATRPSADPLYNLQLYAFSLERSAILAQLDYEEKHALDGVQTAYEEERERVEDEWRRGRDRVRERLLEGIEERRKRAREEKEGEGAVGDATLDSQSRAHITRKLRNKHGTSPPPTFHYPSGTNASINPLSGHISSSAITSGPFINPHSLSVDELPSPFPLPLTSTTITGGGSGAGSGGGGGGGGTGGTSRRRVKGTTGNGQVGIGGLGKSLGMLVGGKESEIETDLNEIRRGNKRKRAAAVQLGKSGML